MSETNRKYLLIDTATPDNKRNEYWNHCKTFPTKQGVFNYLVREYNQCLEERLDVGSPEDFVKDNFILLDISQDGCQQKIYIDKVRKQKVLFDMVLSPR